MPSRFGKLAVNSPSTLCKFSNPHFLQPIYPPDETPLEPDVTLGVNLWRPDSSTSLPSLGVSDACVDSFR